MTNQNSLVIYDIMLSLRIYFDAPEKVQDLFDLWHHGEEACCNKQNGRQVHQPLPWSGSMGNCYARRVPVIIVTASPWIRTLLLAGSNSKCNIPLRGDAWWHREESKTFIKKKESKINCIVDWGNSKVLLLHEHTWNAISLCFPSFPPQ